MTALRRCAWTGAVLTLAAGGGVCLAERGGTPDAGAAAVQRGVETTAAIESGDGAAVVEPAAPRVVVKGDEISRLNDAARRVLRQDQFRYVVREAPPLEGEARSSYYLQRLLAWVQTLEAGSQWAIVILCLAALAAVSARFVSLLRRVLPLAAAEGAVRSPQEEDGAPDPALERARAEEAARLGDFARALRHLHRYLRLELDRRRLLPYRESWTNWEYLQAASRTWLPLEPMRELTARCDRVFYGGGPGTWEDYEASFAAVLRLLESEPGEPMSGALRSPPVEAPVGSPPDLPATGVDPPASSQTRTAVRHEAVYPVADGAAALVDKLVKASAPDNAARPDETAPPAPEAAWP